MKQRIRVWLAALAVMLGMSAAVAVATPAQASFDWCHGVSVVCFAEHTSGGGLRWGPAPFTPYGKCYNIYSEMNDKISSLWNKYGVTSDSPPLQVTIYQEANCIDVLYTYGPDTLVNNIGWLYSDETTSVCVGPRRRGYCG